MKRYIKYRLPYDEIYNIINTGNYNKINFFIDFQSICSGLYTKANIFFELNHYIENKTISRILIHEYRDFLESLSKRFSKYSPFFITFYDDGKNLQNTMINSSYKHGGSSMKDIIVDDDELVIHYEIKKYYFSEIKEKFTINNHSKVFYLKEYESDCIPFYCIKENLFNSANFNVLNIILSNDKDLLQCCQFKNTFQCTKTYFPSREEKTEIKIFNDENAISYLDEKLSGLNSKYIPLILSISGDTADKISGIPGYKYIKATKLIKAYNLPPTITEIKQLKIIPEDILNNMKQLEEAFKMIDFEEQLKRINNNIFIDRKEYSVNDILDEFI